MDKKYLNPPPRPVVHSAYFFTWSKVDRLGSALLSGFFHRPVMAKAYEDDCPDNWFFGMDAPISIEELRMLMNSLQVDDRIWDANDYGDDPVWGFSQGLSEKVVAQTVPYPIEESMCSESGLWLICSNAGAACPEDSREENTGGENPE